MISTKIIADSPEPVTLNALINNDTKIPAISIYNREDANEMKKYVHVLSSNKKNTAFAKINPIYNTPATFHIAFVLFVLKNGTDSIVSSKKKTNWYKGWRSK